MPLNANIILSQNPADVNAFGRGLQQGTDLSNAMFQRKQQEYAQGRQQAADAREDSVRGAMSGAFTVGPDGRMVMAQDGLKQVAQADPQKAYALQQQMDQEKAAQMKAKQDADFRNVGLTAQLLGGVKDQQSYDWAVQSAMKLGLAGTEKMPRQYDPKFVSHLQAQALTAKEQMEMRLKEMEAGQKGESHRLGMEKTRAEIAETKAKTGKLTAAVGSAPGAGGMNRERFVPGVGETLTKDDAKQLKDAQVLKAKLDRQLGEMMQLRKEYGTEFGDRAAVARGQQLSKDLLLTYKNLSKLGVLSKSDEEIVNAIIPADPLQMNASTFGWGKDPIMNNLEKFRGDLDADYQANISARTAKPIGNQQAPKQQPSGEDAQALAWLKQNRNDPSAAGVEAALKAKGLL